MNLWLKSENGRKGFILNTFKSFLYLIRVIFPTWNFFDQVGDQVELRFKLSDQMAWQTYSWERSLPQTGLFFNPDHNLRLAHQSTVEHFIADLQKSEPNVENLTSYKLLKSFLIHDLVMKYPDTLKVQFQIRIQQNHKKNELFTSQWILKEPF